MSEKLYRQRDFLYQAYWIEGLGSYKIANICNCNFNTIINWMKKYNIERRQQPQKKYKNKLYRNKDFLYQAYWIEEYTIREIASICNSTFSTVQRWLHRQKIPLRDQIDGKEIKLKRGRRKTLFNKKYLYEEYIVNDLTLKQISNKLNVSPNSVYRQIKIMLKNKYKKYYLYYNKDFLYQAYWIEELSLSKIAKICDCNSATIIFWMKRYGIKRRSLSKSNKIASYKNESRIRYYLSINTDLVPQDIPQSLVELQREKLKLKYTAEGII